MESPSIAPDQVVGRVHRTSADSCFSALNSIGRTLPDNAPLYTAPQPLPAGQCCQFNLDAIRTVLREEATRAAQLSYQRDLDIAEAVAAWYENYYGIGVDKPALENIIKRVPLREPSA